MEHTLICTNAVQKVGYTIIDGVKIAQYICVIPIDKPEDMRISSTRVNKDLYKEHRDICRKDLATFEDACYDLQEELIAKMNG